MAKTGEGEASGKQTTVEEGTQFKGTLQSNCPVMVRGAVEGDLSAPSVIVSSSGAVTGNVKAECIRSEGVLAGNVDAADVYLSGSVRSDTVIRAKTLEVKLQRPNGERLQVTFGECMLEVGEDPRVEAGEERRAPEERRVTEERRPHEERRATEERREERRAHEERHEARRQNAEPSSSSRGQRGAAVARGSTPPKAGPDDESKKRNSVQPPPS